MFVFYIIIVSTCEKINQLIHGFQLLVGKTTTLLKNLINFVNPGSLVKRGYPKLIC